jgi:hypothetical protein
MVRFALLAGLAAIAAMLAFRLLWIARRGPQRLSLEAVAFGFVANFFDTLGIGLLRPPPPT